MPGHRPCLAWALGPPPRHRRGCWSAFEFTLQPLCLLSFLAFHCVDFAVRHKAKDKNVEATCVQLRKSVFPYVRPIHWTGPIRTDPKIRSKIGPDRFREPVADRTRRGTPRLLQIDPRRQTDLPHWTDPPTPRPICSTRPIHVICHAPLVIVVVLVMQSEWVGICSYSHFFLFFTTFKFDHLHR